jgi:opacity protein-like surface antigen
MKFNLSLGIVILAILVNVQTAVANGQLPINRMFPGFPASWVDAIIAWHQTLAFIGTTIMGALAVPGAMGRPPRSAVSPIIAFFVAIGLFLMVQPARAADVAPAAQTFQAKAIPFSPSGCSIKDCSGLYAGFGLSGNGTSADIIGSGLSQSVFAAGAMPDIHVGYQMWNGSALLAFEAGIGNNFQSGPIQFNGNSLVAYEGVKLGGTLAALVGGTSQTATTVAGQTSGSLPVWQSLASNFIAGYVWLGAVQRSGYNQGTVGAGMEYVLAANWNLDVRYEYAPPLDNLGAMQLVRLGLNYHFGLK